MKPLSQAENQAASDVETITYTLPAGASVTTRLETDSSTTINVNIPGFPAYSWNSGIAVTCFILGNSFGITAGILSRNPHVGTLTNFLVSRGCSAVMKDIQARSPSDDGDS
jgi:hypothetical protein